MTDPRWEDVRWSIASAVRHFRAAVEIAESPLGEGDTASYRNEMALMHAMQSGYTSFENALLRILKILDEEPPSGADWHKQLVERCARAMPGIRPAILTKAMLPAIRRLRSFRHWASHGYDEDFNASEALEAVAVAKGFADCLHSVFEQFIGVMDP